VKQELFAALNEIDESKRTGCLNYFFTKILRFCPFNKTISLLSAVITQYFLTDISYAKLEQANGFICRIRSEFKRRKWSSNHVDVFYVLDVFAMIVDVEAEDYEDQKIQENGDV
jgi:hypothetical protein